MKQEEIIMGLRAPFHYNEIEWRILNTTKDKSRGLAVPYIDSRAIQNRLDEVVGPFNWRNDYMLWQNNAQICGIAIYDETRQTWVMKHDGAPNSDFEAVKGGLSDSFKRAAVHWNIGRYLYQFDAIWVDIEPRGKSFAIKQDQYGKLEADYNKSIAKIFNTSATPVNSDKKQPSEQSAAQVTGSKQPSETISFEYKIKSVKPSGKASQLLELVDKNGEVISAYVKKSDKAITTGSCLRKVDIVRKDSSYGPYNLINAYELAA